MTVKEEVVPASKAFSGFQYSARTYAGVVLPTCYLAVTLILILITPMPLTDGGVPVIIVQARLAKRRVLKQHGLVAALDSLDCRLQRLAAVPQAG